MRSEAKSFMVQPSPARPEGSSIDNNRVFCGYCITAPPKMQFFRVFHRFDSATKKRFFVP
jgi:hypothetical protein